MTPNKAMKRTSLPVTFFCLRRKSRQPRSAAYRGVRRHDLDSRSRDFSRIDKCHVTVYIHWRDKDLCRSAYPESLCHGKVKALST